MTSKRSVKEAGDIAWKAYWEIRHAVDELCQDGVKCEYPDKITVDGYIFSMEVTSIFIDEQPEE